MGLPKFIFIHILKTGGTTFRYNILERFYKGRYLYDGTFKVRNKEINRKLKREKKPVMDFSLNNYPPNYKKSLAIFGHFRIEKYEHLNLPFVTFFSSLFNWSGVSLISRHQRMTVFLLTPSS